MNSQRVTQRTITKLKLPQEINGPLFVGARAHSIRTVRTKKSWITTLRDFNPSTRRDHACHSAQPMCLNTCVTYVTDMYLVIFFLLCLAMFRGLKPFGIVGMFVATFTGLAFLLTFLTVPTILNTALMLIPAAVAVGYRYHRNTALLPTAIASAKKKSHET